MKVALKSRHLIHNKILSDKLLNVDFTANCFGDIVNLNSLLVNLNRIVKHCCAEVNHFVLAST